MKSRCGEQMCTDVVRRCGIDAVMYTDVVSRCDELCNELRGNMARSTQFPIMITRSTIIYEIVSPGAAGSSIYI